MLFGSPATYEILSTHDIAEVRRRFSDGQKGLFALKAYQSGEVITGFSARTIMEKPTYLTLQLGIGKHITLQPEFLQYINHSCEPNVFFNTTTMQLVALKKIEPGDEFCFFYPSTEWKISCPFDCYCGHACCIAKIKGAAYLSKEAKEKYKFTDFIQQQFAGKNNWKNVA